MDHSPNNRGSSQGAGGGNVSGGGSDKRSVPEWVADHPDQEIPKRVKLRIWTREGGRCYLTGRPIKPGDAFQFEHVIALANGGQHRESNIRLALDAPHKEKTAEDVATKAKFDRVALKHRGLWGKPVRKLQGRGFAPSRKQGSAQ